MPSGRDSTIVFVQLFELPSAMAHAIQIVHTAAALARRGHAVWLHPRVGPDPVDARRRGDPLDAARAILGEDLPATLHVDAIRFRHKGLAGLAFRKRLLQHLVSDAGDTAFWARQRRQTVGLLRMRRALRRRTPIVYELHNLEHVVARETGRGARADDVLAEERRIAHGADALVAISDPLADDTAAALGVARPTVIPDGVDLARFAGIAHPFAGGSEARIVYAGGLFAHKGVESLLAALELLPERVALTVVGGNPPEELARLRDTWGPKLGARVRFAGQVDAGAVPAELARADLIVLPAAAEARSQRYTSPLKLFEAMATGAPIVAAPAPSFASVLADGETAFVAADGTPAGLADGVRRALSDVDRARAVGQAARAAAEAYGWDRRAEAIEAVLAGLTS